MIAVGRNAARWAGRAVLGFAVAIFALNLAWVARHYEQLRPVAPGDPAPPFELARLSREGKTLPDRVALKSLRGRVVLIDFWAAWCEPCRDGMPSLERLYQRYRERGFEVVSIKTDGPEMARADSAVRATTFPIVLDHGHVMERYKVSKLPHLVLVDRDGVVRRVHRGPVSEKKLISWVEALLSEM